MTSPNRESMHLATRRDATPTPGGTAAAPWEPRSAGDAALRFALGFGVTQPGGLLLLALVFGRELPLRLGSAWVAYGITVLLAGATVGILWFRAQRLRAGTWRREWALASLGCVGFVMLVTSHQIAQSSLAGWVVATVGGSATVGAVIAGFSRLRGPRSDV